VKLIGQRVSESGKWKLCLNKYPIEKKGKGNATKIGFSDDLAQEHPIPRPNCVKIRSVRKQNKFLKINK
jgi:hypothetical protein